jgi:protein gp37
MGENSKIEWTAHTFNIVWGCTKVSPGCKHCYAAGTATWRGHDVWGPDKPRRLLSDAYWREPLKWNAAAQAVGKVARVFCSSMADVFEDHPTNAEQRARLWALIGATPHLQWLLLTKRPENVRTMVPERWLDRWPANVLPGFTAENQEWFDRRREHIDGIPSKWFLSFEPALGPIDFRGLDGIAWLIVGGESGGGARPMMLSWVRSARDQAVAAGVPFFLKQKIEGGKKVSLPVLDGRQWSETP